MTITELLKKADSAPPVSKSKWAQFVPVAKKLEAEKGYSTWKSVQWLIQENAIPEESQRVAYHSILQALKRSK